MFIAIPVRPLATSLPIPQREGLLLVVLAIALHGAIIVSLHRGSAVQTSVSAPHEIELLRVVPVPPVQLPPPPELPRPHLRETPPAPSMPAAALRTEVPQAPIPEAMTVPQNLTAAKSSGPLEAAVPPPAPHVEEQTEPNGFAGYLNNPPPAYPKVAQRLGLQGHVLLRVHVLASGKVDSVEVRHSSGNAILDDAALAAVKGWTFAPAKRGSIAIDAWAQVPIDFRLAS